MNNDKNMQKKSKTNTIKDLDIIYTETGGHAIELIN